MKVVLLIMIVNNGYINVPNLPDMKECKRLSQEITNHMKVSPGQSVPYFCQEYEAVVAGD